MVYYFWGLCRNVTTPDWLSQNPQGFSHVAILTNSHSRFLEGSMGLYSAYSGSTYSHNVTKLTNRNCIIPEIYCTVSISCLLCAVSMTSELKPLVPHCQHTILAYIVLVRDDACLSSVRLSEPFFFVLLLRSLDRRQCRHSNQLSKLALPFTSHSTLGRVNSD